MRMSNLLESDYESGSIPTAFLSHEDHPLIGRLLKREDVRLQLSLTKYSLVQSRSRLQTRWLTFAEAESPMGSSF
jgi:hypothetical protein